MNEYKNQVAGLGCTVDTLAGFPWNYGNLDAYTTNQLETLRKQLDRLGVGYDRPTAHVCVVNSNQLEAKKILEEHGFKELGRVLSCHSWSKEEQEIWEKQGFKDEGGVCYLMGKGFFRLPETPKKPRRKMVAKAINRVKHISLKRKGAKNA